MKLPSAAFDHTVALEHTHERSKKAPAIKQKAPTLDVFAVEGRFHGYFKFVASVNLRPAGQADRNVIRSVLIPFGNQVVLVPERRTRTDNAHGPLENVEHLRELVEACLAKEPAHACNPFFRVAQFVRRGVLGGIDPHCAKLVDVEVSLVDSHTFLFEKHGAFAVKFDGNSDNEHRERKNNDTETREHDIDQTFKKKRVQTFTHLNHLKIVSFQA